MKRVHAPLADDSSGSGVDGAKRDRRHRAEWERENAIELKSQGLSWDEIAGRLTRAGRGEHVKGVEPLLPVDPRYRITAERVFDAIRKARELMLLNDPKTERLTLLLRLDRLRRFLWKPVSRRVSVYRAELEIWDLEVELRGILPRGK